MTNLCAPGQNVCLVLSRGCTGDKKAKAKRFLGVTLIVPYKYHSMKFRFSKDHCQGSHVQCEM